MEILVTKKPGFTHPWNNFTETFADLIYDSDAAKLASGYISVDSILYITEIVKEKFLKHFELIIGMHAIEGFTKAQYEAASNLNSLLVSSSTGNVYVLPGNLFHGKFYVFLKDKKNIGCIAGSSNISNFVPNMSSVQNIETDVMYSDDKYISGFCSVFEYVKKFTVPIEKWTPGSFREVRNDLLRDIEGAIRVDKSIYEKYYNKGGKYKFTIPLKPEEKSNLNVYFGKGRVDKRGRVRPRPWYEIEIILSSAVFNKPHFPTPTTEKPIVVITDDGWSFECYRGGDNDKNFRTIGDLKLLGMWIKGRLEEAGVLKPGEMITYEILDKYGRRDIDLISTSGPGTWLLNFKPNK